MGFKTFVAGVKLTASELNTYLMNQVVIVCTSATRPASPVEGMKIFETDTDREQIYSGSAWVPHGGLNAWTSYSPTWSGLTVGNGTVTGAYQRWGKTFAWRAAITFGSTSSMSAGTPTVTTPFTLVNGTWPGDCHGYIFDTSATNKYFAAIVYPDSTTTVAIRASASNANSNQVGEALSSTVPMTWTTGDAIYVAGTFEMA